MALKRVCDITGIDLDVEVCDVKIANQAITLDLSPAGAEKLRTFFGPAVTVHHPLDGPAAGDGPRHETTDGGSTKTDGPADSARPDAAHETPAPRSARQSRKPATVTPTRKKASPATSKPVAQDTTAIRAWARANGFEIGERGAIPARIRTAYTLAHE